MRSLSSLKLLSRLTKALAAGVAALTLLGASAIASEEPPTPRPCPAGVGDDIACYAGRDANGAFVLMARPRNANGALVVHMHGGPRMAAPAATTSEEDLVRFVETVREGYAWVSTSRRRGGFGVTQGAEDADNARRMYVTRFGRPEMTLAHGQSWGGNVGAILIEKFNQPDATGRRPYDGALLTAGVLAGGVVAYDPRLDLRAAFQVACATHPRPDEQQYVLGIGLPPGVRMSRAELEARFNACTGANRPAGERTAAQARAISDLTAASGIPLQAMMGHLWWMTNVAHDISQFLTGGQSAFTNIGVQYRGTADDAAFNAAVPRIAAEPQALAKLANDSTPTGKVTIPVLTMHAIHDTTVVVENQSVYREAFERAGIANRLLQVFVDDREHSKVSPPHYPALFAALRAWVQTGQRPTASAIAASCEGFRAAYPGDCRFKPDFVAAAWTTRANERVRPVIAP